jgi:uncharacterized protein (TIGR02646 family)
MIPVVRPVAPAFLLSKGAAATRELCDAYNSAPGDYKSGAKSFPFDDSLYAATAVKDALRDAQHKKCAFCESLFAHTGYEDVEHFRPKAGYKQKEADELRRPGYYWLAYEWNNLCYSCQLCNQRFKRNLFPLKDGRRRARSPSHNLSKEEPLLVDPSTRDPADYLDFREEYAFAVSGCPEGAATIEVLGLNREELVEVRRDRLARLRDLVLLCTLLREKIATAPTPDLSDRLRAVEATLRASREAAGEYAAMSRAYLDQASPARIGI